jgi:primosomal protein N'
MSERIYYCEYCADHYSGKRTCPECGREGTLV